MNTKVMKALGRLPEDEEVMQEAKRIIKAGGIVAIPTETVYGLAGNALDPSSSEKIYEAKGRPSDNPLIVHIADIKDLPVIARDIPEKAYALAEGLRRIISEEPFGKIGQITCSIGVTTINADDSFDDAFNRMDRALYNAKSSGRNCVKSV